MIKSFKTLNSRGDTIVEVLIAVIVIGAILVGGFVLATTSLTGERESQERSEALQVAEGQIETLKSYVAINGYGGTAGLDNISGATGGFCVYNNSSNVLTVGSPNTTPSNCNFNQGGQQTTSPVQPYFMISDAQAGSGAYHSNKQINLTVTWQGINGQQTLTMDYRFE
jgi:type II secretory pathway pseudopilin PulG